MEASVSVGREYRSSREYYELIGDEMMCWLVAWWGERKSRLGESSSKALLSSVVTLGKVPFVISSIKTV